MRTSRHGKQIVVKIQKMYFICVLNSFGNETFMLHEIILTAITKNLFFIVTTLSVTFSIKCKSELVENWNLQLMPLIILILCRIDFYTNT